MKQQLIAFWQLAAQLVRTHLPALTLAALAGAVVRIWLSGKLSLYIHPSTLWWVAAGGAVLLVVAVAAHKLERVDATKSQWVGLLVITGVLLLVPNVSLSPGLAKQRDTGQLLPTTSRTLVRPGGATQNFTILEWLAAWEGDPSRTRYAGAAADVTGFLTENAGEYRVNRYLITCCAVDAQLVQLPLRTDGLTLPAAGTWVKVQGKIESADGLPRIIVEAFTEVEEPAAPYLY